MITSVGVEEMVNEDGERFGENAVADVLWEDAPGDGAARAWLRRLLPELDRHGKAYAASPVALALGRWR